MTLLTVDHLRTDDSLAQLEPEWLALEAASGNTLPFRTFTWTSAWWCHMRQARLAARDQLALRTVRDGSGRLVAVAPLVLTERPAVGPLRARCLRFVGADPNMTEVRGALCATGLEAACCAAVQQDLARSGDEIDWVEWAGIEDREGVEEELRGTAARWGPGKVCSVLDLPATWDELRASRPRNLKESLRRCYNSLKRDGLEHHLEVVVAEREVAPALGDFFRLHSARAGLRDTTHHKDVFEDPAGRAFLLDACEGFARRGALRIFRLRVGGKLAATRIGFVLGGCLYLYYSGFDTEYADYGVMTTAVAEAIRHAIGEGLTQVNLSTGRDSSKSRWRPREVLFHEAMIPSGRASSAAKYEAIRLARRATASPAFHRYGGPSGQATP